MSIWGTLASKSTLKRIQTIQNTCLSGIEPKLWPEESNKKHKILRVEDLIKLEQYKLGYKACNKLLPTRLLTWLFTDSKDRSLLHSNSVVTPTNNVTPHKRRRNRSKITWVQHKVQRNPKCTSDEQSEIQEKFHVHVHERIYRCNQTG